MQHRTRQLPPARLALAIVATALTVAMWVVFAASAQGAVSAQAEDPAAGTLAATSSSVEESTGAPSEPTAPPTVPTEPVDTPEPEATEVEGAAGEAGEVAGEVPEAATAEVAETVEQVAEATQGESSLVTAAAPSAGTLSEPVGRVGQGVTRAAGPIVDSAKTAVRAIGRTDPSDHVRSLTHDRLQLTAAAPQNRPRDLADPGRGQSSPLPAGDEPWVAPHHTDLEAASAPPPDLFPGKPVHLIDSSPMQQRPAEPMGARPQRLGDPSIAGNLERGPVQAALVSAGRFGEPSRNLAPRKGNDPVPPPDSPQTSASGLSGSSFVPIVALLALLALAAPTILRRLREGPDFRAPSPFACALERPG